MSVSAYFGCPGCGKSSILTLIAQKELKRIAKGKSKYTAVYTNFPCSGCIKFRFSDLGKVYFHNCLMLIDEVTLDADSRNYKNFPQHTKEWFCLHRHFGVDCIYSLQDWSRADKTIRELTTSLYYVDKFLIWSIARPIFRTISINDMIGDLIMGYRFPNFWEAIGNVKIYRISKAWTFYNSFDKYGFDELPPPATERWP